MQLDDLSKTELQRLCRDQGISFRPKETRTALIGHLMAPPHSRAASSSYSSSQSQNTAGLGFSQPLSFSLSPALSSLDSQVRPPTKLPPPDRAAAIYPDSGPVAAWDLGRRETELYRHGQRPRYQDLPRLVFEQEAPVMAHDAGEPAVPCTAQACASRPAVELLEQQVKSLESTQTSLVLQLQALQEQLDLFRQSIADYEPAAPASGGRQDTVAADTNVLFVDESLTAQPINSLSAFLQEFRLHSDDDDE